MRHVVVYNTARDAAEFAWSGDDGWRWMSGSTARWHKVCFAANAAIEQSS